MTTTKVALSLRVRPDSEVPRWVYDAIVALEAECDEERAERERLRGLVETLFDSRSKAEADSDTAFAERDAARAEIERLRAVLDDIKWQGHDSEFCGDTGSFCAGCEARKALYGR